MQIISSLKRDLPIKNSVFRYIKSFLFLTETLRFSNRRSSVASTISVLAPTIRWATVSSQEVVLTDLENNVVYDGLAQDSPLDLPQESLESSQQPTSSSELSPSLASAQGGRQSKTSYCYPTWDVALHAECFSRWHDPSSSLWSKNVTYSIQLFRCYNTDNFWDLKGYTPGDFAKHQVVRLNTRSFGYTPNRSVLHSFITDFIEGFHLLADDRWCESWAVLMEMGHRASRHHAFGRQMRL